MRLKRNRTWSQHQLAVKLGMTPQATSGILTWERRRLLIHAAKTAMAAALCWWLALCFGLHEAYWGPISAIIVLQSNVGSTINASRERLIGTLIGAVLGFSFSLFGPLWLGYILALLVAIIVCGLLGLRNSSRLACVTITIVMLVQGSRWELAASRVGEVAFGIVVALAVTTLVFPDRARLRLRDGLAQEFLLEGAFFEAILKGFRDLPASNLSTLREDLKSTLQSNQQLLEASRHEPSSGPGWREGLAMLSQFGTELFDALLALELSVEGSHKDASAQRLEPQLGRLAADIRSSFHHLGACIHQWRFNAPPHEVDLERDIAELEAGMSAVRHMSIEFAQADILRAYAVQLHMKQIARLLRTARTDTRRAVREAAE